jgi:hypothetical protein
MPGPGSNPEIPVDCALPKNLLTLLGAVGLNFWEGNCDGGIIGLIIQLVAGGVGGKIAGSALKQYDLGMIGNTIAGVVGGGVGAQIIGALVGGGADATRAAAGGLDIGSIIAQIASGGVGGSILMVIIGLIKQAMGGQKAA